MGFTDDVTAAKRSTRNRKFEEICFQLGEEVDEFLACLDDQTVPYPALRTVLKARGISVSENALSNWRRKRAET